MTISEQYGFTPVNPDDRFKYHCSQCGKCCHAVKDAIMVESLDLFRMAKCLKIETSQAMEKYTHMVYLTEYYPVLMLNTIENRNTCVFLKDNKCGIQNGKPRACRMYPLGCGPNDDLTDFEYCIVSKKPHHFTGETHTVKDWFGRYLTAEDREYIISDMKLTREISKLLRKIPEHRFKEAVYCVFLYKYGLYETDGDFKTQFMRNAALLIQDLKKLI